MMIMVILVCLRGPSWEESRLIFSRGCFVVALIAILFSLFPHFIALISIKPASYILYYTREAISNIISNITFIISIH